MTQSAAGFALDSRYESSGFFVVRSSLLPFAELERWNAGFDAASLCAGPDAATRLGQARRELVARLRAAFAHGELREALLFASPELEANLAPWLDGKADPKLERTLSRYYARAAGRETPFGLFAGVSLGSVGDSDEFRLVARSNYRRHTRLGMAYLIRLLSELGARDGVGDRLRFEPSTSLYRACGRIRFATLTLERELAKSEAYPVVDVEPTPHLEAALQRAQGGATLAEIADSVQAPGVDRAEAEDFARRLVEHEILVPAWLPSMSGSEPFAAAVEALAGAGLTRASTELAATCRSLEQLDRVPLGAALAGYRNIAERTANLAHPIESSQRFQTDLVKPAERLSLSKATLAELLRAAELLQRTAAPPRDLRLDEFRTRFEARYEARFVPLVEALDADLGIGYDRFESDTKSELLEDVPFGARGQAAASFDAFDAARLRILNRALAQGGLACELDTDLLALFPERKAEALPESFALFARLGRAPDGALRVIVPSLIAPSALALLARFCHADPELARCLAAHAELEQARAGDAVLADVVHLPNAHVANILLRPVLRAHEISYLGKSGAPDRSRIALDDLFVGVDQGRIVLRSKRLDRRVSVRITNAHNFEGWWNLPLYRFLGALQNQDHGSLSSGWYWGALEASPFLPRVTRGNVVLSRARWLLSKKELEPAQNAAPARAFELVQTLREKLGWPRWLSLPESDQRLPIDLDNPLSVEVLLHEVRERPAFVVEELLPAPDELLLSGPEGRFGSELLVPFVRRAQQNPEAGAAPLRPLLELDRSLRSREPGTDWLFVKIYAGRSQLRSVLKRAYLAIDSPEVRAAAPLWFFVPFSDPEPHLRLRFQGDPRALTELVLAELRRALAPLLESGVVFRFQLDSYEREIERYGGPEAMALSEQLFCADSEAVTALLDLIDDDDELGWQLALLGIDRLFSALGLDFDERASLIREAGEAYASEFSATTATWRKIGDRYRKHAARLGELLFASPPPDDPRLLQALAIFERRGERIARVRDGLAELRASARLAVERGPLLRSYAHMHAIRMLGDGARYYELVFYDFLRRQYAAHAARSGRAVPGKGNP